MHHNNSVRTALVELFPNIGIDKSKFLFQRMLLVLLVVNFALYLFYSMKCGLLKTEELSLKIMRWSAGLTPSVLINGTSNP